MFAFEAGLSVIEQFRIVKKNLPALIYRRLMNWHGVVDLFC
jgi:hypothetical protein